jgi:hypothetical protein
MFDFDAGDELTLLAETVRAFAAEELAPRLREHEAARAVAEAARAAARRIGLAGLELPEKCGGRGGRARARWSTRSSPQPTGRPLALDPLGPALYPLALCGGDAALRELALPLLAQPGARAVLLGPGDASWRLEGDRATGRAPWVPSDRADLVVVLDEDGACAIRAGVEVRALHGAGSARPARRSSSEGAPARRAAGPTPQAPRGRWRAPLSLRCWSALRHAAEFSRRYAMERVAFGVRSRTTRRWPSDRRHAHGGRRRAPAAARGRLARQARACRSRARPRRRSRSRWRRRASSVPPRCRSSAATASCRTTRWRRPCARRARGSAARRARPRARATRPARSAAPVALSAGEHGWCPVPEVRLGLGRASTPSALRAMRGSR